MTASDVPKQINRFDKALLRFLSSMRKDLGYKMRSLMIEHNSFVANFYRDRIKEGEALASTVETAGR